MASKDPIADQYKLRNERASAIQKEQSNEAFYGRWLRLSDVEAMLVDVAGVCQGIMAGVTDAARSAGASPDLINAIEGIVVDAQRQIATQMDPSAMAASQLVEAFESDESDESEPAELPIAGPKERKAGIRKPRGVGKMGRS